MSSYVPRPASAPSQHSAQTNPFEFAREHTIRDDWALRLDPETDTPDRLRAGAFAIMSEGFGIKDPTGRVFSGAQQNALDPKEYFAKARACWDAGSLAPVQSEGWNAYHDAAEKGDRATMRRLARENIRGEDAGNDVAAAWDPAMSRIGLKDDWDMERELLSVRDVLTPEEIAIIEESGRARAEKTAHTEFASDRLDEDFYENASAFDFMFARNKDLRDEETKARHAEANSRLAEVYRRHANDIRDEQRLPAYERQLADENLWATVQGLRGAVSDDAWRVVEMAQQSAGSPTQKRVLDAFGKLTTTEQRSIAGVLHALHYGRDTTLVGDAFRSFWDTAAQTVGGSARAIADVFRRGVMDGEEYRDMVERRALLEQANSGRMKEWGYFGQSVVGAFSTIPYMAVAAIPYAGTAAIMASASDQFQTEAALNGVDVGSREFMLTNWAFSGAYAAVEKLQVVPFKPLKNVSRRQMYCEMFHSLRSALFVAGGVAGTTVSESVEEGIQGGIERVVEGWGLGRDQAKEFAAGFASDFVGSLGTMAIIGAGGAGVQHHRYRSGAFSPEEAISATARVADLESRIKGHPENAAVPLGEFSREFGMLGRDWVNAGTDGTARIRTLMRWGFSPEQATRLHGMFSDIWKGVSGDEEARSEFVGGNRVRSAAELLADTLGVQVEDGENGEKSVSFKIGRGRVNLRFNPADRIETAVDVNDRTQAADVVEILNRNEEATTGTRGTMTVDEWLALPEEVRREQTKGMAVQGGFRLDAPDGTSVGEDALRVLSGRVIETDVALPQTVFHESMHAVLRLLREEAAADPEAKALQEELAKVYAPQEGIDEAVNEEALADGYQTYLTSLTTAVEDTGVFARLKQWIARLLGRATVARDSLRAAQSAQGRLFNLALTGDITPAMRKEEAKPEEPRPSPPPAPATSAASVRLSALEAELAATPDGEVARRQRLENRIAEARRKVERENAAAARYQIAAAPSGDDLAEARRQYDEVVARYTNPDGTKKPGWMKAPNGADTHLDERQWVQVRTPNFRNNFFGDWLSLALRDAIEATEPIDFERPVDGEMLELVEGYRRGDAGTEKKIIEWAIGQLPGGPISTPIGPVTISRGNIRSILHHAQNARTRGPLKVLTLPYLAKMLEKAVLYDERADGADYFYNFAHRISFDGVPYIARIIVKREADGGITYDTEFTEEKKLSGALATRTGAPAEAETAPARPTTDTLLKALYKVKPENVSKVVDGNGEPLVVWHGSAWDPLAEEPGKAVFGDAYRGTGSGDNGFFGRGFYFAFTEDEAQTYGPRTGGYFLNLRNPFVFIDEMDFIDGLRTFDMAGADVAPIVNLSDKFPETASMFTVTGWTFDANGEGTPTEVSLRDFAKEIRAILAEPEIREKRDPITEALSEFQKRHGFGSVDIPRITQVSQEPEFTDELKKKGHDGVLQSKDGDEAVAFSTSQIKSATDNAGTFSGANPDIRYSVTPAEDAAYMDAVRRGDMEVAQRMVREAAAKAGYETFGFHGTRGEFTVFDKKRIGTANDEGWLGRGFYFWDRHNEDYAQQYARGGKVMEVYLSMQEPYFIGNEEMERLIDASDRHDVEALEEFTDNLKGDGYDSVVDNNGQMLVFEPQQIKSADAVTYDDAGNVIPLSQRFNPQKEDIRYQISGLYTGSAADYAERVQVLDKGGNVTGYRIDNAPSLKHIGTGEGSQVYGWGLYASGVRGVAEDYAKQSETNPEILDQQNRSAFDPTGDAVADEARKFLATMYLAGADSVDKAVDMAVSRLRDAKKQAQADWLQEHRSEFRIGRRRNAVIYEQTFFTNRATPEETERHLLKWYEPVSEEQLEWVEKQLRKESIPAAKVYDAIADARRDYEAKRLVANGEASYEDYVNSHYGAPLAGEYLYEFLSQELGSERDASEFLARAGIDGVKYPVDSYLGKVKDGDKAGWNYVSFRDDNIRVDHKWVDGEQRYQISGTVGAEALGIRGLADAEAMERSGADRLAIWRETGWWRGKDGEWRVEIPDFELSDRLLGRADDVIEQRRLWNVVDVARKAVSDAEREYMQWANKAGPFRPNSPEWEKDKKLIRGIERLRSAQSKAEKAYRLFHDKSLGLALAEGRAVTLSDIIKPDSALANAYPGIGKVGVYANQPLPSGVAGRWNGHSIELAPELLRGDMERLRSVLAHEVQHVVQRIEGFAPGGSEETFAENVIDAESIRQRMFSPELSEEEYERLRRRLEEIEENALDGSVEVDGDVYEDEFDAYRHLAGEADARLVQKRLGITPEQRAARPPWEDYDVDEDRQIVRFSVGLVHPWPDGFPNVMIHTTRAAVMAKHAEDFAAAKSGDWDAAARLVRAVVKPDRIKALVERHPNAIVVPVNAEEATGNNRIPLAYAAALVDAGLEAGRGIRQTVRAHHTGANAADRLLRYAEFDGPVQAGREYVLVDDHVTQGGTLNELRNYIESRGGKVVEISCLTASKGSTILPIRKATLDALREKFGPALEDELKAADIAGRIDALTEGQGRYLLKLSPDTLRERSAAQGLRRGLGPSEGPVHGLVQVGAARAGAERAADSLSRTVNETLSAAGEAYRASVAWNGPAYSYKSFATAYAARDRILGIDRPDDDYRRLLETMGVRDYSVDDLKADADRIRARGLGRNDATLQRLAGLAEQESMARTVESLMRGSLELGEDVGSSARRAYETYLARMRRTAKGRDYTDLTADLGFDLADLALAIDPEAFAPRPKPDGEAAPPESGAAAEDPEVAALLDGKAADFGLTEEQLRERIRERMEQRTQEIRERLERIRARLDEWRAKEARRKAKLAERQVAEGKTDENPDLTDAEMFDAEGNETEAGAKRLADFESECVEEMPDFKAFLEECRRNGLDLSDAAEFVAAVRIWSEDFIARETGADPEKVLRDPVNLARYRATMMEFLHGMADAMLDPEDGAAAKTAERMMQEIPSDATVGEIDGRARTIVGFIQRNGIRQTRKQLIRELRKQIKVLALQGRKFDEMERDAGRKVTGEREAAAWYIHKILTWSDGMIAKESASLHNIVAGREDAYRSAGADDAALKDLARTDREVHRAAEKLQALQMYGGLRKKSPAEIKLAARAIMSWLTEEREAHEKRWNDWHARLDALAQRAAKAASASAQDYTPEDPGYVGKLADELTATIRQRLEQLFVGGGADARAVIDEVMRLVYTGSERMRAETAAARRRTDEMLERCVQGTGRNVRQFLKDLDALIPEDLNRQLRTAEQPVRMTNGQALQLLASLEQVASYAGNIEANGRGAERVVGTDPDGNPITEPQTPHAELLRRYFSDKPEMVRLLEGMREVYEERRGALSDTFRSVTGNPILAPDPLYAPVKMFRGASEGFETQVRAWDPFGPALQPRIKNTLDFDLSASIMDVYNNRTRETCRALAWGIPGMELRSVLCRREVQDAIARTHGKFPLRQLVAHLTDLVSDGWADEPSGFKWLAQKLGGATTYSALSWNVVTALKQTTSIPAWTALMDGGYAEVFRHIANFDRAACRELMAAPGFAARYGADSFAQMFKDAIRDPNANPLQRFFQAGMTAVQMGDFVPGILVGTGVYKAKKLALMRQGLEERQAREEAARITWGLIEECQQSSRLENSPAFLRRGGFLARQAAKFASSPLLQVSHEVHTLRMWAAEAKAEARRNGGGVRMMSDSEDVARWRKRFWNQVLCNHVLMPAAMYAVATAFNLALGSEPPDKEEVLGDLVMQMISGPFGRVFLLGMIFDKGGETVARAMGGKPNVYDSTGLAAQQYLQKLFGQLGRIGGDVADADWESVRDDLLKMLGQVSAPARYAVKIGQNAAGYDPAEARRERKAEIRRERGE